ncbi:MAG: CHAT domain-containing protein [Ardenticatenaceae bacterium]
MSNTTSNQVIRLASLVLELNEKRRQCKDIQQQISQLKATGMVVVQGEEEFVLGLSGRLDQAQMLLNEIRRMEDVPEVGVSVAAPSIERSLDGLANALSATEWRLLEEIEDDLEEKKGLQQEINDYYAGQINKWPLRRLQLYLADALRVGAPVRLDKAKIDRWSEEIGQARRYLREQQYEPLQERLHQLCKEFDEAQEMLDTLIKKREEARTFFRQAELLLLRSPIELNKQYHYSVILRTPSEPGTPGINIHDSSTVVEQDRLLVPHLINQITKTIYGTWSNDRLAGSRFRPSDSESESLAIRGSFSAVEQEPPKELNEELRQVGKLIYRLFIPEPMQSYLSDRLSSLAITTNDLELPWELMVYPDRDGQEEVLCLHRPVARMPTGGVLPRFKSPAARSNSIADFLLIYVDSEGDLQEAEREVDLIQKGLKEKWNGRINIDVYKNEQVTGQKLNQILLEGKYDVIHYAGHASFNQQDPDLSGLLLHDGEVFLAQKIRRLLEGRPLVFLNACESGVTANEAPSFSPLERQSPAAGLASAFIYGGALGCIGSLWPVYDRPAAEFAVHFYNLVLEGYIIGEAMRQARLKIYETHPNDMTWAAFILYGDPTFVLGQTNLEY